jgi:hypothetical protein
MDTDSVSFGSNAVLPIIATLRQAIVQEQAVVALVTQVNQTADDVGGGAVHLGTVLDIVA